MPIPIAGRTFFRKSGPWLDLRTGAGREGPTGLAKRRLCRTPAPPRAVAVTTCGCRCDVSGWRPSDSVYRVEAMGRVAGARVTRVRGGAPERRMTALRPAFKKGMDLADPGLTV
jgi:hypothetical protein